MSFRRSIIRKVTTFIKQGDFFRSLFFTDAQRCIIHIKIGPFILYRIPATLLAVRTWAVVENSGKVYSQHRTLLMTVVQLSTWIVSVDFCQPPPKLLL